jgi:hypothetical protein
MDSVDDPDSNPATGKHQKTTTGAVARVCFDGVKVPEAAPCTRAIRKSMRSTTKASTKKDVGQLVQQLALVLPQLSSAFFRLSFSLFVTENAVIDVTMREMVNNIAPLYTFQIKKKLSKSMQPILKYSKNNMWFF